jgi:hypothetical protein
VYLLAAIPAASVLIPLFLNYMEETPQSAEEVAEARSRHLGQWELVFLCLLMFAASVVLTYTSIATAGTVDGVRTAALVSGLVALVVLICFSVLLSPTIAKFNAFSFIQACMAWSTGGAAFYFFIDNEKEYPEGPHFTPYFYLSVFGVEAAVASLLGIYMYQRYLSDWNYQKIFMATNLMCAFVHLPDILIYTRYNLKLGIPDSVFVVGSGVYEGIIEQWMWMPQILILAALCPKGREATMIALLAGCHNLGSTIAANCSALMLTYMKSNPSGELNESHQFENLWKGSLFCCMMPFLTIVMIPWLVPNKSQIETLLDDSEDSAIRGSLYRRWTGRD